MNISAFNSGTDAIMYQLKCLDVDTIIVPQNLCPTVMARLSRNYDLILAQVRDHFEPADYAAAVPVSCDKTAVLFVHPYGIYKEHERNLIVNLCHTIIDDCCLCDPVAILRYHVKKGRRYIFSFGYSKVLDFGGGGLLISPELPVTSAEKLMLPQNYYGISAPEGTEFSGTISMPEFVKTPFFSWLVIISNARTKHRNDITTIYRSFICDELEILDSPWRMVIKVSSDLQAEMSHILNCTELDIFVGSNYPLLDYCSGEVSILGHLDESASVPLNLFHDFRFDIARAKLLGGIIKGAMT